MTSNTRQPVVRISTGHFTSQQFDEVERLIRNSLASLGPPIRALDGLLYYHVGVDRATSTVVNVSIWETETAARQMDALAPMLAQRPIMAAAGVRFDPIVNYVPLWKIEAGWSFGG